MNCPTCRSSKCVIVASAPDLHLCSTCGANFTVRDGRPLELRTAPDLLAAARAMDASIADACDARDAAQQALDKELEKRRADIRDKDAQITELTRRRRALLEKARRVTG